MYILEFAFNVMYIVIQKCRYLYCDIHYTVFVLISIGFSKYSNYTFNWNFILLEGISDRSSSIHLTPLVTDIIYTQSPSYLGCSQLSI